MMPRLPFWTWCCGLPRAQVIGAACGLAAVALFSGFTVVSRMGFTATAMTLPDLALLRFCVAGTILLPVLCRRGLAPLRWHQAAFLALVGGLGFALFAYAGFRLAPASHGGVLLHGTIPLFTFLLLVCGAAGRRATAAGGWGLSLILAGILAMLWDSMQGASARQWLGDGALLLAALCWSAYGIAAQRLAVAPLHAAAIVATGAMAVFVPLYMVAAVPGFHALEWRDVLFQAVFQGLLLGVVSILVYTRAVALLGAQRVALFTALVPGVTTVAALWLLEERPSWEAWSGVAAVTTGMCIAMRRGWRR